MHKLKIALVANAPILDERAVAHLLKNYSRVVAVDGGLNHCHRMGIAPDCYVGDLDSAKQSLLSKYPGIETIILNKDKDETDLEAALKKEFREDVFITVFGAAGGRTDHTIGNILLLARYPGSVWMESESEYLFAISQKVLLDTHIGQTLSLLPLFGASFGIHTKGLQWELTNGKMDTSFFGVSNICKKSKVEIEVEKGTLLCCLLKEGFHEHPLHTTF